MEGIDERFSVAPMMDWTDSHWRCMVRGLSRHTVLYTEMVVDSTILHQQPNLDFFIGKNIFENPSVLQFGGSEPEDMARAVDVVRTYGDYSEYNLNCGCPSSRVSKKCFGAKLMLDPERVRQITSQMARTAGGTPVTVKCRLGVDEHDSWAELLTFIRTVAQSGVRKFVLHARKCLLNGLSTKQNREVPPLNYEWVHRLAGLFPEMKFVINGGIRTLDEAETHVRLNHGVEEVPSPVRDLRVSSPQAQHAREHHREAMVWSRHSSTGSQGSKMRLWDADITHDPYPLVHGAMVGRGAYQNPCMLATVDSRFYGKADPRLTRRQVVERYLDYTDNMLSDDGPVMSKNGVKQPSVRMSVPIMLNRLHSIFAGCAGNSLYRTAVNDNYIIRNRQYEPTVRDVIEAALVHISDDDLDAPLGNPCPERQAPGGHSSSSGSIPLEFKARSRERSSFNAVPEDLRLDLAVGGAKKGENVKTRDSDSAKGPKKRKDERNSNSQSSNDGPQLSGIDAQSNGSASTEAEAEAKAKAREKSDAAQASTLKRKADKQRRFEENRRAKLLRQQQQQQEQQQEQQDNEKEKGTEKESEMGGANVLPNEKREVEKQPREEKGTDASSPPRRQSVTFHPSVDLLASPPTNLIHNKSPARVLPSSLKPSAALSAQQLAGPQTDSSGSPVKESILPLVAVPMRAPARAPKTPGKRSALRDLLSDSDDDHDDDAGFGSGLSLGLGSGSAMEVEARGDGASPPAGLGALFAEAAAAGDSAQPTTGSLFSDEEEEEESANMVRSSLFGSPTSSESSGSSPVAAGTSASSGGTALAASDDRDGSAMETAGAFREFSSMDTLDSGTSSVSRPESDGSTYDSALTASNSSSIDTFDSNAPVVGLLPSDPLSPKKRGGGKRMGATGPSSAGGLRGKMEPGTRVQALYRGRNKSMSCGTVTAITNELVDVRFDCGEVVSLVIFFFFLFFFAQSLHPPRVSPLTSNAFLIVLTSPLALHLHLRCQDGHSSATVSLKAFTAPRKRHF
jgi:tRNA dihydrouridine synthase A